MTCWWRTGAGSRFGTLNRPWRRQNRFSWMQEQRQRIIEALRTWKRLCSCFRAPGVSRQGFRRLRRSQQSRRGSPAT